MSKTRTFVAIAVTPEIVARVGVLVDALRRHAQDFRWVADENLHYTLQFLGDLTDAEVAEVCQRVVQTAERFAPFSLAAHGAGAFPNVERPKTLWVGAREGAEEVAQVQAAIEQELADLGFRGENRQFVPHLTIGRIGRHARRGSPELPEQLLKYADFEAGVMTATHVTVYASELGPEGPRYHVLASAPFTPGR